MTRLGEIEDALRERGLAPRGAFHPTPEDGVPEPAAGTLILAGQVGASHWDRFERERRDEADPLDRWAKRALDAVAERFGARVFLPAAGLPFQRWARRAEAVHPSPLGILIHPDFGLWHAYRGALLFAERFSLPPRDPRPSPCDACRERPCLRACPVGAFDGVGYDDASCAAYLATDRGTPCFDVGCLARAACPIGREHRYPPEVARFHVEAFLRARLD